MRRRSVCFAKRVDLCVRVVAKVFAVDLADDFWIEKNYADGQNLAVVVRVSLSPLSVVQVSFWLVVRPGCGIDVISRGGRRVC